MSFAQIEDIITETATISKYVVKILESVFNTDGRVNAQSQPAAASEV